MLRQENNIIVWWEPFLMEAWLWWIIFLYLTETVPFKILLVCYGTTVQKKLYAHRHLLQNSEKSNWWNKERCQNRLCFCWRIIFEGLVQSVNTDRLRGFRYEDYVCLCVCTDELEKWTSVCAAWETNTLRLYKQHSVRQGCNGDKMIVCISRHSTKDGPKKICIWQRDHVAKQFQDPLDNVNKPGEYVDVTVVSYC